MVSRRVIEFVVDGVAAILIVMALQLSPLMELFEGRWYIPLFLAVVLIIYANKIAGKLGR